MTDQTSNDVTNFKIIVPLKYLGNFWRTLETGLLNAEINLNQADP